MPILDNVTGFTIHSKYFCDLKEFTLFPSVQNKKNRIAVIYGRNGSGKSTIARGFYEYANSINPRTVDVQLSTNVGGLYLGTSQKPNKIFVFDEEYIDRNVKIKEGGLGSIVLLGNQVGIEDEIIAKSDKLAIKKKKLEDTTINFQIYDNIKSVSSPDYWHRSIIKILRGDWANTAGKRIKGQLKSSTVNDAVIDKIAGIKPSKSRDDLAEEFEEKLNLYNSTSSDMELIDQVATLLSFDSSIESVSKSLLLEIVSRPALTSREKELLELFGINELMLTKGYLQNNSDTICPKCLQHISTEHVEKMVSEIDNIISREFEDFKARLSVLTLQKVDEETFSAFENIDSALYSKLIVSIKKLNEVIEKHNTLIETKLNSPFEIVDYSVTNLCENYNAVNSVIRQIEQKRIEYNAAVADRSNLMKSLLRINDEIASWDIKTDYKTYKKCKAAKEAAEKDINDLKQQITDLEGQIEVLNAERQNLSIAADTLNDELKYIFFSNKRLSLYVDDNTYKLQVNGEEVEPSQVSSGERNALALCYFFSDIAKNMDARQLYSEEMLLVIDDPVSSFDFENRVGIMSFLRYKLKEVLVGCESTKVIILSHDMSTIMDLQKATKEIQNYFKDLSKSCEYKVYALYNKELTIMDFSKYNEYTDLLKNIFEFANQEFIVDDISIGNQMRRVIEAFSTFSYKKSIEAVSTDENILAELPTENTRRYFENLMYRLVLHGESHMKDTARFLPQTDFYANLSPEEKQRTAKDVLCFMYLLNKRHILSHIPEAKDKLEQWKDEII